MQEGTLARLIPLDGDQRTRSGHAWKYRVEDGDLGDAIGTVIARQLDVDEHDFNAFWFATSLREGGVMKSLGFFTTPQAAALRIAAEELLNETGRRALAVSLMSEREPVTP